MRGAIASAFVLLALTGCASGDNTPTNPHGPLSLKVGETATYALFTHCGVLYVTINGTTFYADPPLTDGSGSGNPPAGWGNPMDTGQITLITATTADFSDSSGHRAHFTSTPSGPTPTIQPCY
jgi:hypothetical protein